jgi:metallo-beta-lactamase class B
VPASDAAGARVVSRLDGARVVSRLAGALLASLLALGGCATARPVPLAGSDGDGELRLGDGITVRRLAPGVWLHVTSDRGIAANGLLVDVAGGSILVDSGWSDAQAERLFAFAARRGHPVGDVIISHFHADRLGGAGAALRRGIAVHAFGRTIEHARTIRSAVPNHALVSPATLERGGVGVEVYFPGAAHSDDNVVVWLPGPRILFAGCLAKASGADELGYVADANLAAWPASLAALQARYPAAVLVVPGHGAPGGDLLAHTLALLAKAPR